MEGSSKNHPTTDATSPVGHDENPNAEMGESNISVAPERGAEKPNEPTVRKPAENADRTILNDPESMSRVESGPPYSSFSKNTKRWITAMVTTASFVSPLTAN